MALFIPSATLQKHTHGRPEDIMKALWHSNAPWSPTGYGQQTGLFTPLLKERYDLAISSFYGLDGARIIWNGIPVYPGLGQDFGSEFLHLHAKSHFGGDVRGGMVVTLMDVWVLDPTVAAQMNMVCWVPVDHEPVPPGVQAFFAHGAVPLAMSRFGERELGDLDPLYCPHGIDTETYKPYDRAEVRKQVGLSEDAFLVGMVAANKGRPSRKGFSQAFQAFRLFQQRHNDAYLYLHTGVRPEWAMGENIPGILEALKIPRDRVLLADQYRVMFDPYSPKAMAQIYSSMDVLLNPAMGEGFGLPIIEAQACGVPVIVTNFSSMQELCGAGWQVACRPWWTGQNSWQAMPDVEDIVEALNHCYSLGDVGRAHLATKARQHALQYDLKTVFAEHMLPALKVAEERFKDRKPVQLKVAA